MSESEQAVECSVCCGKASVLFRNRHFKTINGEIKVVTGIPVIVCEEENCGEESLTPQVARKIHEAMGRKEIYKSLFPVSVRPVPVHPYK